MSSFVGMRSSASELDLSRSFGSDAQHRLKRKKSVSSLRNISMFSRNDRPIDDESRDKTSADPVWESRHRLLANKNAGSNRSLRSLNLTTVPQSPDYRTLLMMRRPMSKIPRRYSDYDSCDSDDSDDEDSNDGADYGSVVTNYSETNSNLSRASNASSSSITSRSSFIEDPGSYDGDSTSLPDKVPADWKSEDNRAVLKISVTEQKLTKCLRSDVSDTAWTAKQRIIQSLAKKLSDPFNYGLYCKKLGRFLLDHKPMSEYVEAGSVAAFELRYKRRVFHQIMRSPKESRQLLKMQSSSKRKELMQHVRQKNTDKIHSMIRKGVDPNFHSSSGEDTPLTLASTGASQPQNEASLHDRSCSPVIMALVGGGAHLDFRNRCGLTPVHVAARTSNVAALKTLLDLGASPDVVDARDLTPIYHCGSTGSHIECATVLLQNGARLSCIDSQGWTVLHQVCRYGHLAHLELILDALEQALDGKDLINSRNATGNTSLHVCALYSQEDCLATLLRHGADPALRNYAHQDACQVAAVAGSMNIANLLKEISSGGTFEHTKHDSNKSKSLLDKVVNAAPAPPSQEPFSSGGRSSHQTQFPPPYEANTNKPSTTSEQYDGGFPAVHPSKTEMREKSDRSSPHRPVTLTVVRNISHDACRPVGETTCDGPDEAAQMNSDQYDLLFIACKDYVAQDPREICLTIGDLVTVATVAHPPQLLAAKNEERASQASNTSGIMRNLNRNTMSHMPRESTAPFPTSQPDIFHKYLNVLLNKGADGYGFVLRGAKAEGPIEAFEPTPRYPALQYLESVEEGSNAYKAGLRAGHYITKINDRDVSRIGHRQIVDIIRSVGDPLRMNIIHVITNPVKQASKDTSSVGDDVASNASCSTNSSNEGGSALTSPVHVTSVGKGHSRSGSIGSAIGKLDSVLAMEDGSDVSDADDNKNTATLRRRPVSRRIRTQELQEIFLRQEVAVNGQNFSRQCQSLSAAAARRLTCVLPPKVPDSGLIVEQSAVRNGEGGPMYPASSFHPTHMSSFSDVTPGQPRTIGPSIQLNRQTSTPSLPGLIVEQSAVRNGEGGPMYPASSFHPTHMSSFSDVTPGQPRTIGPSIQLNRQTSTPSLPATARKPPPAPPQRRNSRLSSSHSSSSTVSVSGTSFARARSPVFAPPTTPTAATGSVRTTPAIKQPLRSDASGFAAAVAAAASSRQQRSSVTEQPQEGAAAPKATTPTTPTSGKAPFVAPKPKPVRSKTENNFLSKSAVNGESRGALALALAARHAKERAAANDSNSSAPKAVESTNLVKPSAVAKALRTTTNGGQVLHKAPDTKTTNLPPPLSTPPCKSADQTFVLPPPPAAYAQHDQGHSNDKNTADLSLLPPPPETMMDLPTPPTLPPPPDFAEDQQSSLQDLPPALTSKSKGIAPAPAPSSLASEAYANGASGGECVDSGVDDIGPRHSHHGSKSNIETISVVSSLSTVSSEDGSDVGVSMSYDSKSQTNVEPASGNMYLDVLRKNKPANRESVAGKEPENNLTLTKVQFGQAPKVSTKPPKASAPVRSEETAKAVAAPTPAPVNPAPKTNNSDDVSFITSKPLTSWSVDEVSEWLRHLGLGQYVETFTENEIDGSHLPDLGKDDLQELGITRIGHRLNIEKSVKKLIN